MTVEKTNEGGDLEKQDAEREENPREESASDGEFKLTVRKLEMPVRPRGVLAE